MFRLSLAGLALLIGTLSLSGCVNQNADPLLESPVGQRLACESMQPMLAQDQLSRLPLQCEAFKLSTTLEELRQAGWRLENVDIGENERTQNTNAVALTLTVRKIF